jgi:hypothetical protein
LIGLAEQRFWRSGSETRLDLLLKLRLAAQQHLTVLVRRGDKAPDGFAKAVHYRAPSAIAPFGRAVVFE